MLNIHDFLYCGATVQTSAPCIKEGGIAQSVNQSNHYPVSCLTAVLLTQEDFAWDSTDINQTWVLFHGSLTKYS